MNSSTNLLLFDFSQTMFETTEAKTNQGKNEAEFERKLELACEKWKSFFSEPYIGTDINGITDPKSYERCQLVARTLLQPKVKVLSRGTIQRNEKCALLRDVNAIVPTTMLKDVFHFTSPEECYELPTDCGGNLVTSFAATHLYLALMDPLAEIYQVSRTPESIGRPWTNFTFTAIVPGDYIRDEEYFTACCE